MVISYLKRREDETRSDYEKNRLKNESKILSLNVILIDRRNEVKV